MGHANLTNLSEMFVNLLYAKGRLTIEQAIQTASKRKETLNASEGEYDDDGTLAMGFMDILDLLHSRNGKGYTIHTAPRWEGPWVVPDWDVCKVPKGANPGSNARNLLKQCRAITPAYIPVCPVWENRNLFAVCADAVQDDGHEVWANLIREFPQCYRAYAMWDMDDEKFHDGDEWQNFDKIRWVFAKGWRKRYRDVPRLGNVTH